MSGLAAVTGAAQSAGSARQPDALRSTAMRAPWDLPLPVQRLAA
jgi:hypothetical protein